jgi:hypothetical protein
MRYFEIFETNVSSPEFREWFGDSKIVDASGHPLKLYRGLYGPAASHPTHWQNPNTGYAAFFSTSPYLASTYANIDDGAFINSPTNTGAVYPVYIKASVILEFPIKIDHHGYRSFDMFGFDDKAKLLKPGEALVARQIVDVGPRGTTKTDPEKKYSYPADLYAIGKGTSVKSAVSG